MAKKSFQLVNRESQLPLDIVFGESSEATQTWNYVDWDLDGGGNLRTVESQESLVQNALKAIFTEKRDSGYGTNIFDMIGQKDVVVRRLSLFLDITMCIIALKSFNDAEAVRQNLGGEDLIISIGKLSVSEDPDNPTISRVQMSIIPQSGEETQIGVL